MDDQDSSERPLPRLEPGDLAAGAECRESLTELYGFLDGELTVERRRLIQLHLEDCHGCLEAYDFEAELRIVVSMCCRENELPSGLLERVAEALRQLPDAD